MSDSRQHAERAQRLGLQLPLRYREVGEEEWQDSTTRNISGSGLLFHSQREHETGSRLEIDLRLPAVRPMQEEGAQFVSVGEVVRTVAGPAPGSTEVAIAVRFLEYEFLRRSQGTS